MPHDLTGRELQVGDTVWVPAKVTRIHAGEDYCNLSLETTEPMFPGNDKSALTLNARQVLLQGEDGESFRLPSQKAEV